MKRIDIKNVFIKEEMLFCFFVYHPYNLRNDTNQNGKEVGMAQSFRVQYLIIILFA